MSTAPDMRPESDDPSPKASRGKVKLDQNVKNADTWLGEAIANLRRSRDYYDRAAEWYDKAGRTEQAKDMRNFRDSINHLLGFGNG